MCMKDENVRILKTIQFSPTDHAEQNVTIAKFKSFIFIEIYKVEDIREFT